MGKRHNCGQSEETAFTLHTYMCQYSFFITRECICVYLYKIIIFIKIITIFTKLIGIAQLANILESYVLWIVPGIFAGLILLHSHNNLLPLHFRETLEKLTCLKLYSIELSEVAFESGNLSPHAAFLTTNTRHRVLWAKQTISSLY